MQLNPYLIFNGECETAFNFYARVLGGEILAMSKLGDSPMAGNSPPASHDKIIHARIKAGDTLLMGSDAFNGGYEQPQGFSVTINIPAAAEAERVFDALAEGGSVRMAMQQTFWAERFGMLVDRFGTPWIINCELPAAS